MRARQFEEQTIDEVAMNPTAFAQAIEQGQAKGVLVGFEFEVGIPAATIKQAPPGALDTPAAQRTAETIAQAIRDETIIEDLNFNETSPAKWDLVFQLRNPSPTGHRSMAEAFNDYQEHRLEAVKALYYKIPEKERKKYRNDALEIAKAYVKNEGIRKSDPEYNMTLQLRFGERMGRLVYLRNRGQVEQAGANLMQAAMLNWTTLLEYAVGRPYRDIERNFDTFFAFDPDQAYELLNIANYEEDDDDDWYDDDGDYEEAAKVLQPAVAQTFGAKVNVFRDYHERRKNLTDWYIEPDGSLDTNNDDDATAEIVSPPLPAVAAVAALQNFYQLAAKMNLYTNSSTGLHINVSIPEKLDILKLAVFLGDQHVLKYFGRENSRYAVGAERSIQQNISGELDNRNQRDPLHIKYLQQVAQTATRDHVASISNNGKYISFRHAGGDYLKDYQGVFNVVGRFIRAMVIAADPKAYVQEYKTKLAKLVGTAKNAEAVPDNRAAMYLRTQGTPTLTLTFGVFTRAKADKVVNNILEELNLPLIPRKVDIVPGGLEAQNYIISRMQNEGSKDNCARIPQQNMFVATVYPADAEDLSRFLNMASSQAVRSTFSNSYNRQSYFTFDKATLSPQDPYTQALLKQVLQARYTK